MQWIIVDLKITLKVKSQRRSTGSDNVSNTLVVFWQNLKVALLVWRSHIKDSRCVLIKSQRHSSFSDKVSKTLRPHTRCPSSDKVSKPVIMFWQNLRVALRTLTKFEDARYVLAKFQRRSLYSDKVSKSLSVLW